MSAIETLIGELARLPGIGRKTATRLTYHLLKQPHEQPRRLADALVEGGVRSLEITHDYPRATEDVALLVERYGRDASVGVGTTWTVEQAESAAARLARGERATYSSTSLSPHAVVV